MDRDKLKIYLPAVALTLAAFLVAYQFVDPAPPSTITWSAGEKGGAYYAYAERYRDFLAQQGVRVEILESAGSVENVKRLTAGGADVAFVQGGVADAETVGSLQSLGSLYYEPLWLFLRQGVEIDYLHQLQGRHIAAGLPGSGTRALAVNLLAENGIDESQLLALPGKEAAEKLLAGGIDAMFVVGAADSALVERLLLNPAVRLMSFARAAAYARRHAELSPVLLSEGVVDLQANIPARDVQLLATTATLVAREELHPALQMLILQAAAAIHADAGLFSRAGQFPTAEHAGIALSDDARRFYESGPPFLQRFLPFWAATMVDRLKVMLLPFIALLLPLFKLMPPLYRWRVRSRIYRWYRELGEIDGRLHGADAEEVARLIDDLNRIESEIRKVHVPLSYAEELYSLRQHLALVRDLARLKE